MRRHLAILILLGMDGCVGSRAPMPSAPPTTTWYFAVSGDSRDCGAVIMPNIAAAIHASEAERPVAFYWHLGDFRRMTEPDRDSPAAADAWEDFIARQIRPFAPTPVFLVMGNHELYAGHTSEEYRLTFQPWLSQKPIDAGADPKTYYRFVSRNVAFVTLDNAAGDFDPPQIAWLRRVLAADLADPAIASIVVGMHAALPGSANRFHAMDVTCRGVCSGNAVYEMLATAAATKRIYVFASHSHRFVENVYDQPEHAGRVIPGWIIGTAGAEQSLAPREWPRIRYGYLEVQVGADGGLTPRFRAIDRNGLLPGPPDALVDFCFEGNSATYATPKLPSCRCESIPGQ